MGERQQSSRVHLPHLGSSTALLQALACLLRGLLQEVVPWHWPPTFPPQRERAMAGAGGREDLIYNVFIWENGAETGEH